MTSRMEKVAQDIALTALRKASPTGDPPLKLETLKEAFQAGWPVPDSTTPINDAMSAAAQAASNCTGQDAEKWHTALSQSWQTAVQETVDRYFKDARHCFQKREYLEGAETLTDAVRATLGHIASVRNWPHGTHGDLYSIAAALGSGSEWPETMEQFDQALDNCSQEGKRLGSALGASTGLPDSINFGTYAENPEHAEEDGLSFAETVIELGTQLAGLEPSRA